MAITTLVEFRDYCKEMMGAPIECIQMADSQIDKCIENSVDKFQRYMYGEGLYEDFLVLNISPSVSSYSLSGVEDIVDTYISRLDGINVLHSPTNMLMYNDWILGSGITGQGDGGSNSLILTNYQTARMYLEQVKMFFGLSYNTEYRRSNSTVIVTPTPTVSGALLLRVYKKEDTINLYNHILIKDLAVGLCKKLYGGMNLGKYNVTLPGGGTINYQFIYDQGKEETELALEAIRSEGNPMPFLVG